MLVKSQSTASQNGIWISSTGVWQRAPDFNRSDDVREGTRVWVTDGSVGGPAEYAVTTADPITIGTSSITFLLTSSLVGGALDANLNLSDLDDPLEANDNLTSNGTTVAVAATLNLDTADGDWIDRSGNTGITAVTLGDGKTRYVRFTGTPLITVGASLIGNNNANNVQISAGDLVKFRGYSGGVVRFWWYPLDRSAFWDSVFRLLDNSDVTKKLAFQLSGLTTGNTRTLTVPDADGTVALVATSAQLNVADQVLTGGVVPTSLSLGTISSGTVTPDPGDRPQQHYTNGGAHTLAPSANSGSYLLDITNNGFAGAVTVSGWTKVVGAFTTTNGHKFRCGCSIGNGGSLLTIQALQ